MKFLHTSDIHFGATPDANRPWGQEREKALIDSFKHIIRTCSEEMIDCLIISGGLFDGCPTEETLQYVNKAFAGIPDTVVYIIAGEDDPVFPTSPVLSFRWAGNVIYNKETEFTALFSQEFQLELIGASNGGSHFDPDRLDGVEPTQKSSSILVLSARDIDEESIPDKFTYVALGGSHRPYVKRGGHLVNSGSPEPLCPEDAGKHGYYIGQIDGGRNELISLKFISLPTIKYITFSVNVTPSSSNEDVLRSLKREMQYLGAEHIYHIKLNGLCNPEVEFNLDELKYDFKIEAVDNFTKPNYNYSKLFMDHPSDMVGFFVKEMNREDITEIERKALDYGINALLKTADERI